MKSRFLALAVVFSLFFSPLPAVAEEVPAGVQVEIVLSQGEKIVAKTVLHTDLLDGGGSFRGTAALRVPDGREWVIGVNGNPNATNEDDRLIYVGVRDAKQLHESLREGTASVWALEIFESTRLWKGPGSYRVAEQGEEVLSLIVRDTAALREIKIPGAPEKKH